MSRCSSLAVVVAVAVAVPVEARPVSERVRLSFDRILAGAYTVAAAQFADARERGRRVAQGAGRIPNRRQKPLPAGLGG